jgi:hypothetical protein
VQQNELLAELLSLASAAGIVVRPLPAAVSDAETPAASGVCRVRGALWVLLSRSDPVEAQIAVLARALREHAGASLEERWLPPAVRALLAPPA